MPAAIAATRGMANSWNWGVKDEKSFHQGYSGMQGRWKGRGEGWRHLTERRWERGFIVPFAACWWGLLRVGWSSRFALKTLLPWPRVPFLLLAKSPSLAASHPQEGIYCMNLTQIAAFSALKGVSTKAPGTVCAAQIHHIPFSFLCE